ncbi:hypothetical protein [Actinopolymorpha pittospori]|uniref:Phage baseplate assembly protein W n=1 Tax=Actinopolymorpha pittospori TaxID=648752 RepID=A0A927N0N1_9ACTN|nr:hypothetical protein [Actinopolymorpha pittospori]MBE1610106.1 phage baseplate assembly protein W [Actinopolymorpha pittospori]
MSDVDERDFGVDLLLRPSGNEVRDLRVAGSGRLETASGVDAVVQALTMRLLVRRGELEPLGWPDYGSRLHELIGQPDLPRTRLWLAQYAREAVGADPRVREIEDVTVTTDRFEARIEMRLLLKGRTEPVQLEVAVPLEAP